MRLIAIIGSPKGMQGYTGSLVDPMLKAAQQEGIATEIFSLAELSVLPARDVRMFAMLPAPVIRRMILKKSKQQCWRRTALFSQAPTIP